MPPAQAPRKPPRPRLGTGRRRRLGVARSPPRRVARAAARRLARADALVGRSAAAPGATSRWRWRQGARHRGADVAVATAAGARRRARRRRVGGLTLRRPLGGAPARGRGWEPARGRGGEPALCILMSTRAVRHIRRHIKQRPWHRTSSKCDIPWPTLEKDPSRPRRAGIRMRIGATDTARHDRANTTEPTPEVWRQSSRVRAPDLVVRLRRVRSCRSSPEVGREPPFGLRDELVPPRLIDARTKHSEQAQKCPRGRARASQACATKSPIRVSEKARRLNRLAKAVSSR